MLQSERGPGQIVPTGCQSAPRLGFCSIPPWQTGRVVKDVSMFLKGHCITHSDLGEAIPFFAGSLPLVFFPVPGSLWRLCIYFLLEPSKWGRFWRCHRILWLNPICRASGVGTIRSPSPNYRVSHAWRQVDGLDSDPKGDKFLHVLGGVHTIS
jgi:hypothetical protein